MKLLSHVAAANIGFIFLLVVGIRAEAAELKVLSANGMREVMEDLGPKFERATGHKIAIAFGNLGTLVKRVQDGETVDVIVLPRQGIDVLVKAGKAGASNVSVIARSSIGVAVRRGASRPDISTPDAMKRTLLAAKSITYLDPTGGGVSGVHFAMVLNRLGIADEMKSKTILHANAPAAGVLVASGKAEIGVNLIQELLPLTGIDLVGPLPPDLQNTIVFAAAIMTDTKDAATSKVLVDFLRTQEAVAVIKTKGMEPANQ